jgi:hypothetical protein
MQVQKKNTGFVALAAFLVVLVGAPSAFAAGTTAGTPVSNSASVSYSVGGVGQTAIESSEAGNNVPGSGAPTTFIVDRKIDVRVSEVGDSFTTSNPGSTDQVLTFEVENEGNDVQDFLLTANDGSGNAITLGGTAQTDTFDATAPTPPAIWVDGGDGVFTGTAPGSDDTLVAYLDGMAVDTPVRVFVVRNIDAGVADGAVSLITLDAQAVANSGTPAAPGAALTQDTGTNNQNGTAQIVFADADGTAGQGTDAARDGRNSATDGFVVTSAQLSISKTASVVRDPFGTLAPNAKAIPGAFVEYTIRIENSATATQTATGISISDDLTSEMSGAALGPRLAIALAEYGTNLAGEDIELETNATGSVVTTELSAAADADAGQFVSDALTVTGIALDPGEYAEVRFTVEIL